MMPRGEGGWLLRSGAGLGGMRLFNMAAGLATTVLLTRVLGAEGYGIYALAVGWVMIIGMPMQLGLPTLVMRQVAVYRSADDRQRLKGIVQWSFRFVGLSALVTGLACGAVGAYLHATGQWPLSFTTPLIVSAFALLCLLALISVYRAIISGFENVVAANLPDTLVRPALLLAAMVATIPYLAHDPGTVMALHALAALGAIWLARSMAARRLREIEGDATVSAAYENRAWLSSLWPLTVQSGAAIVNSRLDIAMLGVLAGPLSVANYDVGLKIASISLVFQSILVPLVVVRLPRLFADRDLHGISRLCSKMTALIAASVLFFLLALAFSGRLLDKIFGSGFDHAQTVAIALTFGYFLNALSGPAVHVLNMTGLEYRGMQFVGAAAVLNIGLNFALIPAFGSIGAALATATSGVVLQIALMWFAWKYLAVTTHAFGWSRHRGEQA